MGPRKGKKQNRVTGALPNGKGLRLETGMRGQKGAAENTGIVPGTHKGGQVDLKIIQVLA